MSLSGREHRGRRRPEHSLLSPRSLLIQMIANGTALSSVMACWQVLPEVHAATGVQVDSMVVAVLVGGAVWWKVTGSLDRRLQG